jgi:hypothetical protein
MKNASKNKPKIQTNETMYNDLDYLTTAISFFSDKGSNPIETLDKKRGVILELSEDMKRRLDAVLPDEAKSNDIYLYLSPDKNFCMKEMKESLRNNISEKAWQRTQYLWPLHPIFDWINEKASLLFPRGQAPLILIDRSLPKDETVYVLSGIIPNRNSTPMIDVLFCLHYNADGGFEDEWTMNDFLVKTGYGKKDTPNKTNLKLNNVPKTDPLLGKVINQARKIMTDHSKKYVAKVEPLIRQEIKKLRDLEKKHIDAIDKIDLKSSEKNNKKIEVELLFKQFVDFVHNTLTIENNPYIRVIACIKGA